MKGFIKSLFSDINGSVSSKRLVMFALVFLFSTAVLSNLFYAKTLDSVLKDQLYYAMLYVVSVIFGEQVTGIFKKKDEKPE